MVCVSSKMSRASAGKTQVAGGDIWSLESSGGSSLTSGGAWSGMTPTGFSGDYWSTCGLSCAWSSSQHGDFRVASGGSGIQEEGFSK